MMNQAEWIALLKENEVTITFTKKDGSERVMLCTLKPEHLPVREEIKESTRKHSENNVSVWDLNAKGRRSFVIANVVTHTVK